ncbi:hypothetical protein AAE028_15295 [Sinorhizobium sp. CB9]
MLPVVITAAFATVSILSPLPAYALSELHTIPGQAEAQAANEKGEAPPSEPAMPSPDPLVNQEQSGDMTPSAQESDNSKPVEVIYDISKVPEPVRHLREMMVEAAASGDIERLRPLMSPGPNQTQVMVGEASDDPVSTLKDLSGDSEGMEILAIMLDILSTGFVHVGQGTPDEMYVWPYFAEKDLKTLSPPEKVELLRIVTAGDLSDMLEFGGYNFYRIGITPDGKWKFFTAGD